MNEAINISVVIPVYNAAKTIIRCLNSVLQQTYKVYEIIIINDGSTDNTLSLINDYINMNNINSIVLKSQTNSGPSTARNLGINLSKGNWIAFIDSDDEWLPNKLEKQIDILQIDPSIMLIGTCLINKNYNNNNHSVYKKIKFEKMLFKNQIYTSTVLVSKRVVQQYLFEESQKFSEDYRLWLLISADYNCVVLNDGLTIYAENNKKLKIESLSSKLFQMELGELSNFLFLYKINKINIFSFSTISFLSIVKFTKRYIVKKFTL